MPLAELELLRAGSGVVEKRARSLTEAVAKGLRTAFLCHSHHDAAIAKGLVALLGQAGWNVYVDWEDTSLPEKPNSATADAVVAAIRSRTFFLFLATPRSMGSRWCPWEIGVAEGLGKRDNVIIIPTSDQMGNIAGSEYLGLYRRLDRSTTDALGVWAPGSDDGVRVSRL